MPLSGIDLLFWVAGFVGHLLLLGVLFGRRRAAQFPIFTALIAFNIVRSPILFFVLDYGSVATYFRAYVLLGLLDLLLQLGVVYEVAFHVFRPLGGWAPDVRRGLKWLIWGSLAVASALTWLAAPGSTKWQMAALLKGLFFSAALMSELFLGLVVLSVTVGLPWKTHVARIAHGLGVYSVLDVAIEAGTTLYSGAKQAGIQHALISTRFVVYLICVGYWIVTLWQEAPESRTLPPEVRKQLNGLQARLAYDLYTIRKWRRP